MHEFNEAIVFFENAKIVKEMRYNEFGAVLDGYVGITEHARKRVKCGYLHIEPTLNVRTVVFFEINLDESGKADPSWDLPMERLADKAQEHIGGLNQSVNIVASGIPEYESYQEHLWDPAPLGFELVINNIQAAINRNKLGFKKVVQESKEPNPVADIPVLKGEKLNSENLSEDIEKRIERLKAAYKKKLHGFEEKRRAEIQTISAALAQKRDAVAAATKESGKVVSKLTAEMQEQTLLIQKLQKENEHLKEAIKESEQFQVGLKESNEASSEKQKRLQLAISDVTEELSALKLKEKKITEDLRSSREKNASLIEEVAGIQDLKDSYEAEKANILDQFLTSLVELDLMFVAYHSGAGHISIPAVKLTDYLEHPTQYAADKCAVPIEQYEAWAQHFSAPKCLECGDTVKKIPLPSEFQDGKHNRCILHKKTV